MKKFFLLLLIAFIAQPSWAEESKFQDQKIDRIRPALLVIDVQNEYLPFMSKEEWVQYSVSMWSKCDGLRSCNLPRGR